MTKTTPVFILKYGDSVAMKDDSSPASASTHTVADMTNLVNGDANKEFLYATFEPNSWLLDGYSKFVPASSTKIGFVSDVISDAAGDFASPILLTITLNAVYTFEQLTRFSFSQISRDYCTELKVEYRNASDVLIDDQTYFPDKYEYRAELPAKPIAGVKYVRVYFYSTNRPYRHLRLLDIGFDDILFRADEIKSAVLVEEISRYSTELKSNTLEVSLFSPTGEFSVVSTTGMYAGLEDNQPADMYEEIDGVTNYMGRFYLDKFESPTPNKMNLTLKDGITLLEKTNYIGGFYNWDYGTALHTYSDDLILKIMQAAGLEYEMDAGLENIPMKGILHIDTCRNALQQICFSLGAYATCSRSKKVLIHKAQLATDIVTPDYELTSAQKGLSQSVVLKPLTTSLELSYPEYTQAPSTFVSSGIYLNRKLIYDGNLGIGSYTLDFYPDIAMTVSIGSGGSGGYTAVVDYWSGANMGGTGLIIECTTAGTFFLEVQGFIQNKKLTHAVFLSGVTDQNKVTIKNGSFVSVDNYSNLADELFSYFQERYVKKVRLYGTPIQPGNSVLVDTYDAKQIQGFVENVKTDLAGGFISDVEIVGVLL